MRRLVVLTILALLASVTFAQNAPRNRSVKIYQVDPRTFNKWNPKQHSSLMDSCIVHSDSTLYMGSLVVSFNNAREREAFFNENFKANDDGKGYMFMGETKAGENCVGVGYVDNIGLAKISLPDDGELLVFNPELDYLNTDLVHIYYDKISNDKMNNIPVLMVNTIKTLKGAGTEFEVEFKRKDPNYKSPGVIRFNSKVPIDSTETDSDLRIGIWPYAIEYETDEIKKFFEPRILNGRSLEELLKRDLGYDINKRDKFRKYTILDHLMRTGKPDTIKFKDSIIHVVDSFHYPIYGKVYVMNRNKVLSEREMELDDGRTLDPLRFINVEFKNAPLNYKRYEKYGTSQEMADSKETNLFFKQGSATLDADDYEGQKALREAIDFAESITQDGNYYAQRFEITGYASPEGNYESNAALAQRRANFLKGRMQASRAGSASFVLMSPKVQPWSVVADTLVRMGYMGEAEEVRRICDRYATMNEQYQHISSLNYYNGLILGVVLPKLRIDKIAVTWKVNRVLGRDEIVEKYYADKESYLKGHGHMAYEYYELMQHFEDDIEAVGPLAKVAYEKFPDVKEFSDGFAVNDRNPDRAWSVAAYHYARYLKSQGVYNDTILAPYLRAGIKPNFPTTWNTDETSRQQYYGSPNFNTAPYNDEAIALLQIGILFDKHDYRAADSIFVNCMDPVKYKSIKYFIDCFSDASRVGETEIREGIATTSEWNRFMIYAAQAKDVNPVGWYHFNSQALEMATNDRALHDILSLDDPRVLYTLAIIKYRMNANDRDKNFTGFFRRSMAEPRMRVGGAFRDIGTDEMWQALMLDETILEKWLKWDGYFHKNYYEAACEAMKTWKAKQAEQAAAQAEAAESSDEQNQTEQTK